MFPTKLYSTINSCGAATHAIAISISIGHNSIQAIRQVKVVQKIPKIFSSNYLLYAKYLILCMPHVLVKRIKKMT